MVISLPITIGRTTILLEEYLNLEGLGNFNLTLTQYFFSFFRIITFGFVKTRSNQCNITFYKKCRHFSKILGISFDFKPFYDF